jgi:hypothetical protein
MLGGWPKLEEIKNLNERLRDNLAHFLIIHVLRDEKEKGRMLEQIVSFNLNDRMRIMLKRG